MQDQLRCEAHLALFEVEPLQPNERYPNKGADYTSVPNSKLYKRYDQVLSDIPNRQSVAGVVSSQVPKKDGLR